MVGRRRKTTAETVEPDTAPVDIGNTQVVAGRHGSNPVAPDKRRRTKRIKVEEQHHGEIKVEEQSEVPEAKRRQPRGRKSHSQDNITAAKCRSAQAIKKPKRGSVKAPLIKEESDITGDSLRLLAERFHASDSDSSTSHSTLDAINKIKDETKHDSSADESDAVDWDDVDLEPKANGSSKFDVDVPNEDSGLALTLEKAERIQLAKTGKKKQSIRAVHERCFCHYMSSIALVAHGAWRNKWISDPALQRTMRLLLANKAPLLHMELVKFARKSYVNRAECNSTDFVELLGRVMIRFRKLFRRTKPGYRKLGYRHVSRTLEDGKDFLEAAESFSNFDSYLQAAQTISGSRDLAAQLFTALLRAYHFRVRLVYSIPAMGYKFNEREEFNRSEISIATKDTNFANTPTIGKSKSSTTDKGRLRRQGSGRRGDPMELDSDLEVEHASLNHKRGSFNPGTSPYFNKVIDVDGSSDLSEPVSDVEEYLSIKKQLRTKKAKEDVIVTGGLDEHIEYPLFWTEIYDQGASRWIAIDAMVKSAILVDDKGFKSLHPKGKVADSQKLVLGFVVAYSATNYVKDVTMRYASSIAKVKDAFLRSDGRSQSQYDTNRILLGVSNPLRDLTEREEDDLLQFKDNKRPPADEMPQNLADFKSSPKYLLEKNLREKEALKPGAKSLGNFELGKGSKSSIEKIFLREDVMPCKTIENYHKEGRKVKAGEHPRKMIKARAMTTNRKREYEQMAAETGEPVMQGIYSIDQTEYIVPPPIKNGIIPKNAYGNADVFVPSMVPQGATHLPFKGIARIARKLEIDHAEAVVGFEFKARGAIPVVKGVLVAEENAERLEAAWREAEEARERKENKKRQEMCLKMWAKLLKGLRIKSRVLAEYGGLNRTILPNGSMSHASSLPSRDESVVNVAHDTRASSPEAAIEAEVEARDLRHSSPGSQEAGGFLRDDDE